MKNQELVKQLNNRWTCEFSAAIDKIAELEPAEGAQVVFRALGMNPIGTRPHQIALHIIGSKDLSVVLEALENNSSRVRECAEAVLENIVNACDNYADLDRMEQQIVECSAAFKEEKNRKTAAGLLEKIKERKAVLASERDDMLKRVPLQSNDPKGQESKKSKPKRKH
jgi:hypothetical protein